MSGGSPAGVAVGLGSMPGTAVVEALSIISGETPDLLHLPELPLRGPGADLVGRTFSILHQVDRGFALETTPTGWRLAAGEPREIRRASAWLGEDLDALEQLVGGSDAWVKAQLCGPLTLAAAVEPMMGERLLADSGARRAIADALVEAVKLHLGELHRRLPNARLALQIDEPGLAAALAGSIPTRSGRARLRPVPVVEATSLLARVAQAVRAAGAEPWLHSCADTVHWDVLGGSGYDVWSLPASAIWPQQADVLAAHLDRGGHVVLGFDAVAPGWSTASVVSAALRLARQLGVGEGRAASAILLSHTCGLALASDPVAALRRLNEAARGIRGQSEQGSRGGSE